MSHELKIRLDGIWFYLTRVEGSRGEPVVDWTEYVCKEIDGPLTHRILACRIIEKMELIDG